MLHVVQDCWTRLRAVEQGIISILSQVVIVGFTTFIESQTEMERQVLSVFKSREGEREYKADGFRTSLLTLKDRRICGSECFT